MATDISEQRQAARERQRLEEQLRQSLKMEAIGRLAGGVAHDFNNILTGILGFTELIMTSIDARDAIYEDVEEIRIAAGRAAELTNQLLAFSRKQLVAPRVVRPNDVVASSERMLARIIGEDVRLRFEPDPEAGVIKIDPAQLDQILVNLSVNARDAMPGGGALTIRTAQVVLDGERSEGQPPVSGTYVALSVIDTGHGMDQQTQQHIFEPFFSTRGAGTGLGLATIYGIVKQNAGLIEVSSQPGLGTTFTILFPAVQEPIAASSAAAAAPPGGSEVVLLVEDEKMVRRLAKRILEQQGYGVISADSGAQALQLCAQREGAIDLLLTDVVMPEMNGRELCELLRERLPGLRTLYMSGYTDDIIADNGALYEGTNLIKKPFTVEELAGKVREVLNRAPAAPAPG